ncbi:MAG: acyl-CoA thioesterase [Oscillospiraceae bacterium]|nr:acyl-CoA thioesterase [Oscillospiraceae bacterium]
MYIYQKIPQYYETDQMGIIHHANYIRWFEEARVAYLEEMGFRIMKEVDSPLISPVLTVKAEYLKMIRLHDKVKIFARLVQYNGFRYTFSYEIYNLKTNELACRGTTMHCFLDQDGKPVRMKREFPHFHNLMREHLEDDAETEEFS